jgi:hypothetical protein
VAVVEGSTHMRPNQALDLHSGSLVGSAVGDDVVVDEGRAGGEVVGGADVVVVSSLQPQYPGVAQLVVGTAVFVTVSELLEVVLVVVVVLS